MSSVLVVTSNDLADEFEVVGGQLNLRIGAGLAIGLTGEIEAVGGVTRELFAAQREDVIINDTTLTADYLTLTPTVTVAGDYLIRVDYTWSNDITNNDFLAALLVNGATVRNQRQEPKDSFGGGAAGTNVNGNADNSGTDQRHPASMSAVRTFAQGDTPTITLGFSTAIAGVEATVYDAVITCEKVS